MNTGMNLRDPQTKEKVLSRQTTVLLSERIHAYRVSKFGAHFHTKLSHRTAYVLLKVCNIKRS